MSSKFYDVAMAGCGDVTAVSEGAIGASGVMGERGAGRETGGRTGDVKVAMSGSTVGAGRVVAALDVIVAGDIVRNDGGIATDEPMVEDMLTSERNDETNKNYTHFDCLHSTLNYYV